ncbi:isopenicillin N synthase family oxygenase [Halomonas janggokensis]|uniref:2-oxoglutarate-dependent ethylene/succinate-forming enzyme n=1 Tax=Vreelandella janggokensis TaxID=370767 RepID=A0ABT4IU77_9GAMM|nr:2-oxoglutarate and iron-dependent oxygenase domain-containing protein [Halomonas janggokensis]MCZ0927223.1 isopenicillin N synthase family oxygenase [Halomonas janggokensis]MCZ0929731.1 isopenicillin N synthase family oxygenase [Halomonas janggokensis]
MNTTHAIDPRLSSRYTSFDEVPVIDIGSLVDGSDIEKVAQEIGRTCATVGFFYIRNHGVPRSLIDAAYSQAQAFFNLPFEEKNRINITNSGPTLRGYIPTFAENVDPEKSRDFKECFDLGLDETHVAPFFGPNLMPERPVDFKPVLERYHSEMLLLARKLISAIALSLNLPADYFAKLQQHPITVQRLLHYPAQEGEVREEEIGIGAHTDYGFLTILAQDANGGLQVQNKEGEWISAPPIENTFVVNIGDLVQTFTNDLYKSTVHRVINTSGQARYSLPFFIDMDYDAVVDVLQNCTSEDNPARYTPYTSGQHKFRRYVNSYAHLKGTQVA